MSAGVSTEDGGVIRCANRRAGDCPPYPARREGDCPPYRWNHFKVFVRIGSGAVAMLCPLFAVMAAEPTPAQLQFFENRIRPLLAENCYKCHSTQAEKVKGRLLLDSREGVLKGGDTGPAIVPGDPENSLLIKAVR